MTKPNIYPIFDDLLSKEVKEKLLNQRGIVLWLCGLSGSGKSTIAKHLQSYLHHHGYLTQVLDGDNLRSGLNQDLGFEEKDRDENIRRVAEVAKLFANCGIVTICSFITPQIKMREMASRIIGGLWYEIYINTSLDVCEKRDVKGLYRKARNGIIKNFTGIDSTFEEPTHPNLIVSTDQKEVSESVDEIYVKIKELITN